MTNYKTPLLPPPREILNVGKIYKVAQFCTDLSKGRYFGSQHYDLQMLVLFSIKLF
jgi:hypothetical protein